MGRVLSQGEIDNLLGNLLADPSLILDSESAEPAEPAPEAIPSGIAAFKAKIAAAQAAREAAQS